MVRKTSRVVALFGLPICNVDMRTAVASIHSRIQSGKTYQIATANLDFVKNARRDPVLHRVICDCAMVLPDGFPLLLAARMLGRPLQQRVTGVDLTPQLAKLSAEHGYGIFLLGSTDENAQEAMRILEERYPGVRFVGQYAPPPASLEDMNDEEMLNRIAAAKPDILLVAFGNPKQEFWIHKHRNRLQVPVSIGIGGTLEMIAGVKRRAPRAVQALHLEWIFRMLQEPARLLPRYAQDMWALVRHFPGEILANRLQWSRMKKGAFHVEQQAGHCVISIKGAITGPLCTDLRDSITSAITASSDVTLDLCEATRIEADGLGCLLDMRRSMQRNDLNMYVVGGSDAILRVVNAGSLNSLLPVAPHGAHEHYSFRSKSGSVRTISVS